MLAAAGAIAAREAAVAQALGPGRALIEVVGAVRGIDPETGHYYDDTRRYIDSIEWLDAAGREKIFHGNARRVYGRLPPS